MVKLIAVVLVCLLLSACAPYIAYRHLSAPSVSNDGYDRACTGIKGKKVVELKAGICKDAYRPDLLFEFDIEYTFGESNELK